MAQALLQPGRQSNVMDIFLLALQRASCPLYDTSLSCPECPYFGLPHGGRPRPPLQKSASGTGAGPATRPGSRRPNSPVGKA